MKKGKERKGKKKKKKKKGKKEKEKEKKKKKKKRKRKENHFLTFSWVGCLSKKCLREMKISFIRSCLGSKSFAKASVFET